MANQRKEEIIMATLELAAEHGLGNVSMSMIAQRVGIRKPSLYNHFASKGEIVEAMYRYLREQAKAGTGEAVVDYKTMFQDKSAQEILRMCVLGYQNMNRDKNMYMFYKVIYSERSLHPAAARIVVEETERMIIATKQLFYAMQIQGKLHFEDPDMSAVTFAMTVHGLIDYTFDRENMKETPDKPAVLRLSLEQYIEWFCRENLPGKEQKK